ncbi:exonuclease domain-containing protein [Streptomyces sp. TP-A0874]|uniref:exonuclease domain-containing protein n=1 Tax=Streptomyces sp. TP-A0874 TaxID=549819 RepID=UPI00085357B3|nr:exonuclease domain-containing protein [Streptomyces sp. TP-A0874]
MGWPGEWLAGFDLETTGTDIDSDRIVTGALVELGPGREPGASRTWLIDPGVPIPPAATGIHGISTEQARRHGLAAATGVEQITAALAEVLGSGRPLAVMNARYDLSLLDRECARHGVAPLAARLGRTPGPIIDPLVLDKYVDRYRKGKRNLQALCEHYGVELLSAHEAGADAVAAARVAARIGERYAAVGSVDTTALHQLQVRAAAEQAASFQRYLRRVGDPRAYIDPAWPLIPAQRTGEHASEARAG